MKTMQKLQLWIESLTTKELTNRQIQSLAQKMVDGMDSQTKLSMDKMEEIAAKEGIKYNLFTHYRVCERADYIIRTDFVNLLTDKIKAKDSREATKLDLQEQRRVYNVLCRMDVPEVSRQFATIISKIKMARAGGRNSCYAYITENEEQHVKDLISVGYKVKKVGVETEISW